MKKKRTWIYAQKPSIYCFPPCDCGNENTEWSEFQNHLWCENCKKDFIPKHNGIFDSPIGIELSAMFGIYFTIYDLKKKIFKYPHIKKNGAMIYKKTKKGSIYDRTSLVV